MINWRKKGLFIVILAVSLCLGCDFISKYEQNKLIEVATYGPSIKVRLDACDSLMAFNNQLTINTFISFLDDTNLKNVVAENLGYMKDDAAVIPLILHLKYVDTYNYLAIRALGEIGDPRALNFLIAFNENIKNSAKDVGLLKQATGQAIAKLQAVNK